MTLTEVLVSPVILGLSSQVSFQGWSRTSKAALSSAHLDQQVQLLEQRLLASRRVLASASVADVDCRWDHEAVSGVLEGLSEDSYLAMPWRFDAAGGGLWLAVELRDPTAAIPFKRNQLFTPAGLGHCPREANDEC
ncbi:hypothetical protein [Parasynechococcus sp.]|uniref:hypothetical protein n=1 Tax=Parasynechococcus sp. TaxID=3101203 RepID=UPI0037040D46